MTNYETVFIATPVLSDVQLAEVFSKFQGIITENGGQIVSKEEWGLKKLAYPIQKKTTGYYFLIEFTAEGTIIDKLETQYRRDDKVLRFLTFRLDKDALEWSVKRRDRLANKPVEPIVEEVVEVVEAVAPIKEVAKVVKPVEAVVEVVAPIEEVVEVAIPAEETIEVVEVVEVATPIEEVVEIVEVVAPEEEVNVELKSEEK